MQRNRTEFNLSWFVYDDIEFSLQIEKQEFGLKPMNCPGHCLMFQHRVRSYRGRLSSFILIFLFLDTEHFLAAKSEIITYLCVTLFCTHLLLLFVCFFIYLLQRASSSIGWLWGFASEWGQWCTHWINSCPEIPAGIFLQIWPVPFGTF